jgi:hypothetical protein
MSNASVTLRKQFVIAKCSRLASSYMIEWGCDKIGPTMNIWILTFHVLFRLLNAITKCSFLYCKSSLKHTNSGKEFLYQCIVFMCVERFIAFIH